MSINLNIPENSAVHFIDSNTYLVRFSGEVFQNDTKLHFGYSTPVISLESIDNLYRKHRKEVVKYYRVLKNGRVVATKDVEEYDAELAAIKAEHTNKHGEFLTTEGQTIYRNFMNTHTAQKEVVEVIEPITVNVVGTMTNNTGSPNITCILTVGQTKNGHFYSLNLRKVETDAWEEVKANYPDVKFHNSSTSGFLRFMQANGTYILGDEWGDDRPKIFYGTLKDCLEKEISHRKMCVDYFSSRINSLVLKLTDIPSTTLLGLTNKVNNIRSALGSASLSFRDSKAAQESYRNLRNSVNSAIEMLESVARNKGRMEGEE